MPRSTADFELAAYVLGGEGRFGPDAVAARMGDLVLFAAGDRVGIANDSAGVLDVMVLGGAPAEGPLVFHGPFVMNNVEQVRAAEVAYRTGRMGSLAS
jgi:redox-sensitive bicupin YhaK (pirin superfamily)